MDTTNKYFVGGNAAGIVILNPPRRLGQEDALIFAAWIVAMADPLGEKFAEALDAVTST